MPQEAERAQLPPPVDTQLGAVLVPKNETIPLAPANKLLRKAGYSFGLLSFACTGLSGINNKNPLRTAAGLGTAVATLISLGAKEQNQPLPDKPLAGQMAESMIKPGDNTLFFNRSWGMVGNVLTLLSGMQSGGRKETIRGAVSVMTGGIEVAGLSNQDKREKRAEARLRGEDVPPEEERMFTEEIFANRWISLGSSAFRAALMVGEGFERKNGKMDKHRLFGGIFYCAAVASLLVDNYLVEEEIKETDAQKGKGR